MKSKIPALALALACFGLVGCAQVPMDITRYAPRYSNVKAAPSFIQGLDLYDLYNGEDVEIDANIYEYNNLIALLIAIKNKDYIDIPADAYTIELVDGRDHKTIKMLSRQDLQAIKAKYMNDSKAPLQDQAIEATMNNIMKVANMPTKDKIAALISMGIDNYFCFRPIYAGETREGILCFLPDFRLEYPLTVLIKIDSKELAFQYLPAPKASK